MMKNNSNVLPDSTDAFNRPEAVASSHRYDRFCSLLMGICAVFLFSFAAVRVFTVPFTHDESYSYLNFVEPYSFKDMVLSPSHGAINSGNHLLNTYAMKVVTLILHPDDWTLRLPSLFAYAIFLYAGFKICRQLFCSVYQVVAFILLNLNMYLLQFFSLARGYALALGLMMASLWFLIRSRDPDSNRPWMQAAAVGAGAAACFANLSFLNYYCALLLVLFVMRIRSQIRHKKESKSLKYCFSCIAGYWDMVIASGFLVLTLSQFVIRLRESGQFYYGGAEGFVEDSLVTLLKTCLYDCPGQERILSKADGWILAAAVLLFVFYSAVSIFAKKTARVFKASSVYWVMVAVAISIILQHHLLKTPYPYDRAVILFVPLFVLSAAGFLAWEWQKLKMLMRIKTFLFLFGALGLVLWHFGQVANVRYAIQWRYDSETPMLLECLEVLKTAEHKQELVKLGVTAQLQPTLAFYKKIRRLDWIEDLTRDGTKTGMYDYYYITWEDLDYAKSINAETLKYWDASRTWLMRPALPANIDWIARFHRYRPQMSISSAIGYIPKNSIDWGGWYR